MKSDSCIYPVLTIPEPKMAKKCVGLTGKNSVTETIDTDWPVLNCAESKNNKPNKLHAHCTHELLKILAEMVFLNHALIKSCKPFVNKPAQEMNGPSWLTLMFER